MWSLILLNEKPTTDEADVPVTGLIKAMIYGYRLHIRSVLAFSVSVNITELRK